MSWVKDLGGSLPVENVQELASKKFQDIPHRYIRPELESDEVSVDEYLQIPVIDMSKLVGDQLSHGDELAKLHKACEEWGFFQLRNHGVAEEIIEKMKKEMEEFFKQPLEKKMICGQQPNNIEGYGQAFVVSEEQKLDWGDMFYLVAQPSSIRNITLWSNMPTSFRETLEKYSSELQIIAMRLLRLIERNLGLEQEKLARMFEDGRQSIRMNYYPPCLQADKVMGLTKHSDGTGLTLLIQANEVQGLQINKDGKWISIKPIPGAFIVNIGDILEIMSNGAYKSIEHRAVVKEEKERLSIAAFHSPNLKAMIGPLEDLIKDKRPNYKTITNEKFLRLVRANKLDGKSFVDSLKLHH